MTRVLIIKTSSMGDIVHNMPVVADLRRAQPGAVIDWVVEEAYADLARMTRGLDRVIPVALRRWRRTPYRRSTHQERRAFIDLLRAERYDFVLDTQGLLKSALIAQRARLTRDGRRVGFSLGLVREPIARLFYDRGYAVDPRLHAIERMRALAAAAFGYAGQALGPPRFDLDVPACRFEWLADSARSSGYVVLLHATARAEKAWPAERWIGLIEVLCKTGLTPVLPWGNALEQSAAEALARAALKVTTDCSAPPIIAPRLTLVECAALLAGAHAVVGVDTGLLHLAAGLDVPTVGLFGATPRWRYAPYWSQRAINLGSFGELGAQPPLDAVVDALRQLGLVPSTP
jgi:heptosyltransferase-1